MKTHVKIREDKIAAVQAVKEGKPIEEILKQYGRGYNWLYAACKEYGHELSDKSKVGIASYSTFSILAKIMNTDMFVAEIGREHKVSRQRVQIIYTSAKKAGIRFPNRESNYEKNRKAD